MNEAQVIEKCIDLVMSGKCTLSATTQQAIKERKAKRGKAEKIQKLKARRERNNKRRNKLPEQKKDEWLDKEA